MPSSLAAPAPIVIGAYTLTTVGLDVLGRPQWSEHQGVGDFIQRAHRASGWWLADWMRYGESRHDWADRLSQAVESTGLAKHTLENVRSIGAIPKSRRRENVEFSLHGEVTALPESQQSYWLEKAETEGLTQKELRNEIKASIERSIIDGEAQRERVYLVDVTVSVEVTAASRYHAEETAWAEVKRVIGAGATVTGARGRAK